MFPASHNELLIKSLADFLIQRSGGSVRAGNDSTSYGLFPLSEKHSHLLIDESLAEEWLKLMNEALNDRKSNFTEKQKRIFFRFMKYTAYEIILWKKYRDKTIQQSSLF
jgi:truncated hemoglobin YjbI